MQEPAFRDELTELAAGLRPTVVEWKQCSYPQEVAAGEAAAHALYRGAGAYRNQQEAAEKRKFPLAGAGFVHKLRESLQLFRGHS